MIRAQIAMPIVFFVIFILLYMTFRSISESIVLMLAVLYAMTGGVILQYLLGYNFSVAVWVGHIALYGIAVETGVVMIVCLFSVMANSEHQKMLCDMKTKEDIEPGITHNVTVVLKDRGSQRPISNATVNMQVVDPAGKDQIKSLKFEPSMNSYDA